MFVLVCRAVSHRLEASFHQLNLTGNALFLVEELAEGVPDFVRLMFLSFCLISLSSSFPLVQHGYFCRFRCVPYREQI